MKYFKGIIGVTKRDRARNEQIRTTVKVESIKNTIERQQLRWFGHLNRMGNNRQTKVIWETRSSMKRPRGRPKKRWDEEIAEILKKYNKSWQDPKTLTQDKKE
ncbi:hypothetical protein RN001_009233 [Aquatica leii]|uniref:Endonuclease-reverse transcriptase n=1 Tax=Aquatica leii TaxID=1421715 RepID=A0AAN7PV66_9COLE|nr:hypothetical protein RN001_009233 [Aquatica leii]